MQYFYAGFVLELTFQQAMTLVAIFQQVMIVGMNVQQAIFTELTLSRSCLQNWFSTGHDCMISFMVCNDFRTGLRGGCDFRADLKTIYVYRYGLSEDHVLVLALEPSMILGMAFHNA